MQGFHVLFQSGIQFPNSVLHIHHATNCAGNVPIHVASLVNGKIYPHCFVELLHRRIIFPAFCQDHTNVLATPGIWRPANRWTGLKPQCMQLQQATRSIQRHYKASCLVILLVSPLPRPKHFVRKDRFR
jgi:hypothetical protein